MLSSLPVKHQLYSAPVSFRSSASPSIFAFPILPLSRKLKRYCRQSQRIFILRAPFFRELTKIVSIGTNLISTFLNILLMSRCAKLSSVTDGSSAIASMAAIFSDVVMFASSMCIISSFPDIDAAGDLIWMSVFILRAEQRCSGFDSGFAWVLDCWQTFKRSVQETRRRELQQSCRLLLILLVDRHMWRGLA
jgi:hypothetical protein